MRIPWLDDDVLGWIGEDCSCGQGGREGRGRVACWLRGPLHRLNNIPSSKQATPGRTQAHLCGGMFSHGGTRSMLQRCKSNRPAFLRSIVGIRHPLYAGLLMTRKAREEGG